MSSTVEKLRSEASSLSTGERAELAHFLIQSLEQGTDDDAEKSWDTELDRRVAEIHSGSAAGIRADEVFRKLRAGQS
jgi:putative addiction module component (TIGR02574 family)